MIALPKRRPSEPAEVSPERAALRAKLEAVAEVNARYVALGRAVELAREAAEGAQTVFDAAEAGVRDAPRRGADHAVALAMGLPGEPPQTTREAKATLAEAADNLAMARAARDRLESDAARSSRGWPPNDQVMDVLRVECGDHVRTLLTEMNNLQVELVKLAGELQWLVNKRFWPLNSNGIPDDRNVTKMINRVNTAPLEWSDLAGEIRAGRDRWGEPFAKLLLDADAPCPS